MVLNPRLLSLSTPGKPEKKKVIKNVICMNFNDKETPTSLIDQSLSLLSGKYAHKAMAGMTMVTRQNMDNMCHSLSVCSS